MPDSCTDCGVRLGKDPQDPTKCQFFDEWNPNLFWSFRFKPKGSFNWSCRNCGDWQSSHWGANFCKLCCNCAKEYGWDRYTAYACECCKNRAAERVPAQVLEPGDKCTEDVVDWGKEANLEATHNSNALLLLASDNEPPAKASPSTPAVAEPPRK